MVPPSTRLALLRSICAESLRDFTTHAWPIVDQTRALLPSVALDAVCAALQAVAEGRIKRLAISQPPGTSKSIESAVMYPAWLQLRFGGTRRVMVGSYSWAFAERDSRRCRDLIASEWYQSLVGGRWDVRGDADRIDDYWTTSGGRRFIVSVGGKALGERCTDQIMDEVLSGADVHSDSAKREAARWVNEVLSTRLEDPRNDTRVIVGQRLAVDDPIADAIRQGWKYLFLPALLAEGDERCVLTDDAGELVWEDTRSYGEPLFELQDAKTLAGLKAEVGSSAFAAMYLQRPEDQSVALFKRECFTRRWSEIGGEGTERLPARFDRDVITLDASFKEGDTSDYAVVQAWGALGSDRYLLEQFRKQAGFTDTLAGLKQVAERHPLARIVVEEAANGYAVIDSIRKNLASWKWRGKLVVQPPRLAGTGARGKTGRMASVQGIVERGCVVLPAHAAWVGAWLDEVCTVPAAKNDDQADAMTYALRDMEEPAAVRVAASPIVLVRQ